MRIEYQGVGTNRHAMVYTDTGLWVATVRAEHEAEVAEVLASRANRGAEISTKTEET